MRKLFTLCMILLLFAPLKSQNLTSIRFDQTRHDFGIFKEEAGRQIHEFIVTNTGDRPLVIKNVRVSCGCMSLEWTREPILPGKDGGITAVYDPLNRPGPFSKTLTVFSNTDPEMTTLTITGEVIARELTVEDFYPIAAGKVRIASDEMIFPTMRKNETGLQDVQFINTSRSPATVEFEGIPPYLEIKTEPVILKPGETGVIKGTYYASKNNKWGNVTDHVRVKIDGTLQENLILTVKAKLIEDFSSLTKEEAKNAPVLKLSQNTYNLGQVENSSCKDIEISLSNTGKRDLIIRHLETNCTCLIFQQENQLSNIKSGMTKTIKVLFNPNRFEGKDTTEVVIYSNDPINSEAIIKVIASPGSNGK